jgi:hypothetical protein
MKFSKKKPAKVELHAYAPPRPSQSDEVPPGYLIQGQVPMSKEEYWVAEWLMLKRRSFKYQHVVFAGADHFYKLDFLVYTVPLWTMVEPLGNHWHTDVLGQDDRLRQLRIENEMRGVAKIPIQFIKVEDMLNRGTVEAALERIFHAS